MNEPDPPQKSADPPISTPEPAAEAQPFFATIQGVWEQIKHHKVVQWTLAYLAIAYTLLHGAEMLANTFNWSHGVVRIFTLILILGVPVIITLAWYHGARGLQRVSGTEIMIIAILLALGGAFLWRDSTDHEQATETAAATKPALPAALPTAPVAPDDKSIAVLPFVDMSAEKNQEYMADGMAEELLNLLAQAPDLKVIARTSSFAFKGEKIEIAEIAKKLNVAHVLEGSVRTSGKQMRITAQLVRTADSTHLWSESYDRPMDDIFAVQDEIAKAIVEALQIRLKGGTLSRRAGGTQNLEAYQLYLRAVSATDEDNKASLDAAENYAEHAIKLDPNYGLAWFQLAIIAASKLDKGYLKINAGQKRVQQVTDRALQLSPDIAQAHLMLHALYIVRDFNWPAGMAELQRAVAIDPTNTDVVTSVAAIASIRGNYDDAERQIRAAMQRDPLDFSLEDSLAAIYYKTGRLAEAEDLVRSSIERQPDSELRHSFLAQILVAQGNAEEALAELELEKNEGARMGILPILLHAAGRRAEAEAALKALIEVWADEWGQGIAKVYAYMGDRDRAMEWLERAYQQKDSTLFNMVDSPLYGNLAEDPRYKAFLRNRLKLPV